MSKEQINKVKKMAKKLTIEKYNMGFFCRGIPFSFEKYNFFKKVLDFVKKIL